MAQAESCTFHPSPFHPGVRWLFLFDSTCSTLYFSAFLLSVPFFHLIDEQQPELHKKNMENLCDSANNGGEGTYDVLYLPTSSRPHVVRPPRLAFIVWVLGTSTLVAQATDSLFPSNIPTLASGPRCCVFEDRDLVLVLGLVGRAPPAGHLGNKIIQSDMPLFSQVLDVHVFDFASPCARADALGDCRSRVDEDVLFKYKMTERLYLCRKTRLIQGLFRSRCACTEVRLVYCTTELCLSVDKLKKKKQQQQGRNDVRVQKSMSM